MGTSRSRPWWHHGALLAALLATLVTAGCADSKTPAAELAALEKQGHVLFLQHCTRCHGRDARGGPVPGLTMPAADLTHIAARRGGEFPFGEIARFIDGRLPLQAHRSREMPVWGVEMNPELADPDIREEATRGNVWALVFYLRTIQVGSGTTGGDR